jgi:hypothetical protein
MSIYFHLVEGYGYPDPLTVPDRTPASWKIYMVCIKPFPKFSLIYRDAAKLEQCEKNDVSQLFNTLLIATVSGQDLGKHYHKKGDCHPAFPKVAYKDHAGKDKKITIYRLRQNDIRLYFIYRSDNTIILLKLLPKFSLKLEASSQKEIETLAKIVLKLKDPEQIRERII